MTWEEQQRKSERRWAIGLGLCVAALIVGVMVVYNDLVYGDWTCAFARCVKVENVKGAR